MKDLLAFVSRPIIELKGFQKVALEPGESKEVTINVPIKDLQFLNEQEQWVIEKGTYRLLIGNSSKNLPIKQNIEVL